MKQQLIIDAHAHIFPEKIAQKAVASIGQFYDIPMGHQGLSQSLLDSGSRIGVSRYLVCSTATTPAQVTSINDFIAGECRRHPAFFGFGTLHPQLAGLEAEVERIAALGLHGVKLHPDFQRFDIDDPAALVLYRLCGRAGLPILFHTGDDRYDYSAPRRMAAVARQFPELTCIAAHFGGYRRWQDVPVYRDIPNLCFDTSSSLFALSRQEAVELIGLLGEDRFFFGTDFPMWDHRQELDRFLALGLPEDTQEKILAGNFLRVLGDGR